MSENTVIDIVFDLLDKKRNLFDRLKSNPDRVFYNLKEYYEDLGLNIQKISTIKLWMDNNFKDISTYSIKGVEKYEFLFKKYFFNNKSIEELLNIRDIKEDDIIEKEEVIQIMKVFVEMYIKKFELFYKMNI